MRIKLVSLIVLLSLVACGIPGGNATPTQPMTATTPPEPTLTPTTATPLVILVVPATMNQDESQLYQKTIYDMAQTDGYRFQVRNALAPADMSELGLAIVIAFPPDPGIAQLAVAAPAVHFLVINMPEIAAATNVSVIAAADRPEVPAFLGGYIAAMLSEDWRAGILTEKDTAPGLAAETAFNNGFVYFCGLCSPAFPPYYEYPLIVEVPTDAKVNEIPAYGEVLADRYVQTAYLYPTLVKNTELLNRLIAAGIYMISTQTPADNNLLTNWVATIQPDYIKALQSAWPDLVAGKEGVSIPSPLELTNINEELLTPGKQRLAQEVLDQLLHGLIDTGVKP